MKTMMDEYRERRKKMYRKHAQKTEREVRNWMRRGFPLSSLTRFDDSGVQDQGRDGMHEVWTTTVHPKTSHYPKPANYCFPTDE